MIKPYDLIRKPRLQSALRDYPIFSPPHAVANDDLTRMSALENYEFFLSVKQERLVSMQAWLWRHFRVQADLDEAGLFSLSKWLDKYAMFAIKPFSNYKSIYYASNTKWISQYSALNLVHDTAIFYGDYVIGLFPFLHWGFLDERPLVPGDLSKSYFHATLLGFSGEWRTDPFKISFDLYNAASAERAPFRKDDKNRLLRWVELARYGARHHSPSNDGPPTSLYRFRF